MRSFFAALETRSMVTQLVLLVTIVGHIAFDLLIQNYVFTGKVGIPFTSVYGWAFALGACSTLTKLFKAKMLYDQGKLSNFSLTSETLKEDGTKQKLYAIMGAVVVFKILESNIDNYYMNDDILRVVDYDAERRRFVAGRDCNSRKFTEVTLSVLEGFIGPFRQLFLSKDTP